MDYIVNKNGTEVLVERDPLEQKKNIAGQFKKMRTDHGISQEKAAKLAGMARPDVSRFESGNYNPSLELMMRYAHALGCELKIELQPIQNNDCV